MKQLLTTIAAVLLVGCGNPEADRALLEAVNIEEVKQHLAAGADVNAKRDGGVTSLHSAASHSPKETVELLITKGADVNAKDDNGVTPLHNAAVNTETEIVALLITTGAKVNVKDNSGITPLWLATDRGHKETVELLIAEGADVNAKSEDGETPLDWANTAPTDGELAELLRKHGAKTGEELKAEGK